MELQAYLAGLPEGKREALLGRETVDPLHAAFAKKRVVHAGLLGAPVAPGEQQHAWQAAMAREADASRQHAIYLHIPFCRSRCLYCSFGAEVAYRETLVNERELERLCLGKSRYLLLEMPFNPWTERTLRGVERLANTWGIIPIIAHIERYAGIAEEAYLEELMDSDFPIQLNAGNFGRHKSERNALRLIRGGRIQVLGTDSHNTDRRPPNMNLAIQGLKRHGMAEELEEILQTNAEIFRSARGGRSRAEESAEL